MAHKFSLGETVVFSPGPELPFSVPMRDNLLTKGTITRLLPKADTEYQYHIKFGPDGQLRMAKESQLQVANESDPD